MLLGERERKSRVVNDAKKGKEISLACWNGSDKKKKRVTRRSHQELLRHVSLSMSKKFI